MPKISMDEYAKQYVDTYLNTAKQLGTETIMGKACIERANHIMDFVKAYREFYNAP